MKRLKKEMEHYSFVFWDDPHVCNYGKLLKKQKDGVQKKKFQKKEVR